MDPLSVTASILSIIQLSSKIVQYISNATGSTGARKRLRDVIQGCDDILQRIRDEADNSQEGETWSKVIEALEKPGAPLGRLGIALSAVKVRLRPKDGVGKALACLKWPFEEKELEGIINAIENEKQILDLTLTNENRKLIQQIQSSSRENGKHLAEIVDTVKQSATSYEMLKSSIAHLQLSQGSIQDDIHSLRSRQDIREADEDRRSILNWISPVDYASQQNDFISRRQPGTGRWFLNSNKYKKWLRSRKDNVLFCPGIPGAGKTILASIIIDDITTRFRNIPSVGVAYTFFNFGQQNEQNVDTLLAGLLKQLAQGLDILPITIRDTYLLRKEKRTPPSLDEILEGFKSIVVQYSRAFIIVDGLDECRQSDGCRMRFLSEIFQIQEKFGLSFLATSRAIPDIMQRFQARMTLEIRAHDSDIHKYLEGRISLSGSKLLSERHREIQETIMGVVDGMFLLAQLHFDLIMTKKTVRKFKEALRSLPMGPVGYSYVYEQAMERIQGQDRDSQELAENILLWIACAKRPLSIEELRYALAVEIGEAQLDEENLPDADDMVSVCAGLVTIDQETGVIRLVHHTTQEYFEKTHRRWFPDAQATITRVCITYLSFQSFATGYAHTDKEFEQRLRLHPFYSYAAKFWGHHASVASTVRDVLPLFENLAQIRASSQVLLAEKRYVHDLGYSQRIPGMITGLHLAAYFGLVEVVNAIMNEYYIDAQDGWGGTPLIWALQNGHEGLVKMLIDKGANIEVQQPHSGLTPLLFAVRTGQETVIQLLLEKGANIEVKDEDSQTPLILAAESGHTTFVSLLLDKGADNEAKDIGGRTPLIVASRNGHEAIVNLLLNKGSNIEAKTIGGQTSLTLASGLGYKVVVQLLLNEGANLNNQQKSWSPLLVASRNGHEAVARLLLNAGADIETKDIDHWTPLFWAVVSRCEPLVKLLLDKGADIEARDVSGRTALLLAVDEGIQDDMQQLHENNATIDGTVKCESEGIIRLLLDNGANVNAMDRYGRTPLLLAVEKRVIDFAQLLLKEGADIPN